MRQKPRRVRRLRALRRSFELTQAELSRRSGVAHNTISLLERGRTEPKLQTAQALAAVFKRSVEEIFEFVEVPS